MWCKIIGRTNVWTHVLVSMDVNRYLNQFLQFIKQWEHQANCSLNLISMTIEHVVQRCQQSCIIYVELYRSGERLSIVYIHGQVWVGNHRPNGIGIKRNLGTGEAIRAIEFLSSRSRRQFEHSLHNGQERTLGTSLALWSMSCRFVPFSVKMVQNDLWSLSTYILQKQESLSKIGFRSLPLWQRD